MRFAAIYDIHGNLPALEAVLTDIHDSSVDHVVIGGDVLPGPMPKECFDLLLSLDLPTTYIVGNGDREVLACLRGETTGWFRSARDEWREPVSWSADKLGSTYKQHLESWRTTCTFEIPGIGKTLFCHATPQSDTEVFTKLTEEVRLMKMFGGVDAQNIVCGHTHMQFDRSFVGIRILNAGSVGMPYGEPGAYWLLFDSAVQFRCTQYDFAQAARRVEETEFPGARAFANNQILCPPTESSMLDAFSKW